MDKVELAGSVKNVQQAIGVYVGCVEWSLEGDVDMTLGGEVVHFNGRGCCVGVL
jgi:hypothetical protein